MPRSSIHLNDRQGATLQWIKAGFPDVLHEDDNYSHRVTARALASRKLVDIRGYGPRWVATLTSRGEAWPEATEDQIEARHRRQASSRALDRRPPAQGADPATELQGTGAPPTDAAVRASRRVAQQAARRHRQPKTKTVEKRETYMRYRVLVTRVQVAERWVRAADEEDAAKKVQAEFDKPYGYFGSWKTTTSEVEVVEAEQTTVITPNPLSADGPMLLNLKDAARALGIGYSTLYQLTAKGEIEWTKIGSRKYISRDALHKFINDNTHRGYIAKY